MFKIYVIIALICYLSMILTVVRYLIIKDKIVKNNTKNNESSKEKKYNIVRFILLGAVPIFHIVVAAFYLYTSLIMEGKDLIKLYEEQDDNSEIGGYRKIGPTVQVIQYIDSPSILCEISDFVGEQNIFETSCQGLIGVRTSRDGPKPLKFGDYIIKDPDGRISCCNKAIFDITYEKM